MKVPKLNRKNFYLLGILLLFLIIFFNRYSILDFVYSKLYPNQLNLHPSQTYIPLKYRVIGLDISRYQRRYNWDRAKILNQFNDTIPVQFIIAKATEGTTLVDPLYFYNRTQAMQHPEIVFGAYHFFHANRDVHQQADHFVNTAKLTEGNMIPVIDIEQKNGQSNIKIREQLNLFCNLLENKYGKKPIIYSNKDFFIKTIGEGFKDYPLWVAHYQVDDLEMPNDWDWEIWQLTDAGSSFGNKGNVDVNALNGGKGTLKKLLINQ